MQTTTIAVEVLAPEDTTPMHPAPVAEITTINRYHQAATSAADEARSKAEEASHYALLAGTLLEDLQQSSPHGEWGKLFNDSARRNLTSNDNHGCHFDFSSETARKYIEVAKRIRADRAMSGKAQKQLAAIASAPALDDEAREFLNNLTKGQTLRQLYLDLDIITAKAPKEKPEKPDKPRLLKTPAQVKLEDARESFFLWREQFEKCLRVGMLDDLDQPGLLEMKEFLAGARDRVNARLK